MGCQRAISQRIIEKKADYVLALKGNQSALHDDVKTFVDEQKTRNFADTTVSVAGTVDGDHGRIETRKFMVIHDVGWLQDRHKWPGLKGIVVVESKRESGDKVETETRLFITSSAMEAERLAPFVRGHWAVENSLLLEPQWGLTARRRRSHKARQRNNSATRMILQRSSCTKGIT